MNDDVVETLLDLITDYDEDSYTKNKIKNGIKENVEEIK